MNNSNFLKSMSGILFTILALITASLLPLPSGVERKHAITCIYKQLRFFDTITPE